MKSLEEEEEETEKTTLGVPMTGYTEASRQAGRHRCYGSDTQVGGPPPAENFKIIVIMINLITTTNKLIIQIIQKKVLRQPLAELTSICIKKPLVNAFSKNIFDTLKCQLSCNPLSTMSKFSQKLYDPRKG